MKRPLVLLLAAVFLLAACASPAATPTQVPAAQPTAAPAMPQQPSAQPALPTQIPLATALPEFRPPRSGGVLTPPTSLPTPQNNPANVDATPKGWVKLESEVAPPTRYDHVFAFMPGIYAMIAYGGHAQNILGDTWITSGRGWAQLSLGTEPPPRFGAAAVPGPMIFGGQSGKQFFNDVWSYDSGSHNWIKIATKRNGPAPRAGATIALERIHVEDRLGSSALIVTHGYSDKGYFDDTFMLNSETNI